MIKKYWVVTKHGVTIEWEKIESRARKAFKEAGVGAKLEIFDKDTYHRSTIAEK
jgi:hypothetical protein